MIYNGKIPYDGPSVLKLSDMYREEEKSRVKEPYPLELLVKVIKMDMDETDGDGNRIQAVKDMVPFPSVFGYYIFVKKIEIAKKIADEKGVPFTENDIQKVINECIENNILKDYLLTYQKEVISLIYETYDYEKHKEAMINDAKAPLLAELDNKQAEIDNKQAEIDNKQAEIDNKQAEIDNNHVVIDNKDAEIKLLQENYAKSLLKQKVPDKEILEQTHISADKLEELKNN